MYMMKQQGLFLPFKMKGIAKCVVSFFAVFLFANAVQAQIYASCTHRDYYAYNEATEDFEYQNGYDENSLYKINSQWTMFDHTTPSISSSYYVSSSEYNEEENVLVMNVVSDVGNKYLYSFDFGENKVRILFNDGDGLQLIVFTVKKFWTEE